MITRRSGKRAASNAVSAVVTVLFCAWCNHAVPPRPADEMVVRAFGMCAAGEPAPASLPHVEFWLDDSMSMAGYVNVPSAYKQVVRRVIQGSVQAGYPSSIRSFSSGRSVPLESIGAVLLPSYYHAVDTRLAAILDEVGRPKEKGEPDKIAVLISDLVQDERSRDSLAIASSLRNVAKRYPNVIFYGFRSAFSGKYYIASPARGTQDIYTIDGIGRPFYVLILAPSPDALRQFQRFGGLHELLAEKSFGGKAFEPSAAPVTVESIKLALDADPDKNDWGAHDSPSTWRCADGRLSQILSLESTSARDGDARLVFSLRAKPVLPLVIPSRYQAEVRRLSPDLAQTQPATEVSMTAEGDLADASARLTYRIPRPEAGRWEVYSVRLRAGDANLIRPKWMTEWSTDDDSRPESRDRTLNLDAFGDALVRAIAERTVFLEQVIELYRGE